MIIKLTRKPGAEHKSYVGPEGSLSVDTDTNELYLHDGKTAGGIPAGGASIAQTLTDAFNDATAALDESGA